IDHLADVLGYLDGVGAGFLEDQDSDRLFSVVVSDRLAIRETIVDLSEIPDPDRPTSLGRGGDDDLLHRGYLATLPDRAQRKACPPLEDRPSGPRLVRLIKCRGDLTHRQPVHLHHPRVYFDHDLAVKSARDGSLSDSVQLFESAPEDVLGELLQLPE